MINHKLIMPDGSLIFSNSIVSFSLTESVNDSADISLGSACSAKIDVKIRPQNRLTLPQYGDKIKLYEAQDDGPYEQRGVFFVESCEKESAKSFHLTAYDGVSKLSADVSGKINEIPQWPVTVYSLLKMSVEACGLALADASIPNGDRLVNKFSYGGVTARKVCKWAGEVSGRFCRATPDGKIAFRWYEDFTGTLSNRIQTYYMNGFSRKPYSVEKIERVQIKATDSDIGTSYPSTQGDKNTYAISGNPFLMADSVDDLKPIAQYLYGILSKVSYVPATLEMPSKLSVKVGGIYRVLVPAENDQTIYVMSKTESNFRDRIESTGSQKRGTASHVAGSKLEVFEGKLFEYRRDINGMELRVQASEVSSKEAVKKVNELSVTVGGFDSRISSAETTANGASKKVNELSVTVDGFSGRIENAEKVANGASQKATELSVTVDGFETRVSQAETTASSAKQTADSVSAEVSGKVDAEAGDWTTFGWHLTRDQWSVYSGSHTVLSVSNAGAKIDGEIVTKSGYIGGWGIDSSSIYYSDSANDKSLVMSINGGLYGGTGDREWHIRQNGAALFRSAEIYGDIYANNGFFKGTVYANRISYGGDSGYVSGKCLSTNSVTTVETSTGINDSLGYANFSDDVFNNRAEAASVKANTIYCKTYWSGKHLLKEKTAKVRLEDGTVGTINYMSWY